jgi:putative ABC transport system permease protein
MLSDLRLALRSLARSPGYTAVVIAILALGIGTCAALHSNLENTMLRRYNFPDKDRLVRLEALFQGNAHPSWAFLPRFLAYRERAKSFVSIAGGVGDTLNLVVNGEPEGVSVSRVTANFFTVLGVGPAQGRTFVPADEQPGADNVAVITHRLWRNRFGGDPAILGKEIRLNDRLYQVIGVLPEDFRSAPFTAGGQLYLPYVLPPVATPQNAWTGIGAIARLRPGVSREHAQTELRTILPEQGQSYAEFMGKYAAVVAPIDSLPDFGNNQRNRLMEWIGITAVGFLYLISCVNAGSLMLVRSVSRRRDTGIRLALGASRWDVARPLFAEALVLSLVAIVLGVFVAKWFMPALLAIAPGADDDAFRAIELSGRTLAYLALLGLLTGALVASGPAWSAARLNVNDAMKDGGQGTGESRRMRRLRAALVVIEAALAVALLAGTGLMIRSFWRLQDYDPGYKTETRFQVFLRISREENLKSEVILERYKQVVERLRAVPGVVAAELSQNFNATGYNPQKVKLPGRPDAGEVEAQGIMMTPEFLDLLGLPLRAGRSLGGLRTGDPVCVVVSETFARTYFPGRSPLGERVELSPREVWEIVGVVGDVRSARTEAKPRFYYPWWQRRGMTVFNLYVQTKVKPGADFNATLRRAIYEVEPKFAVTGVSGLDQQLKWETYTERFVMTALEVLGALALLLAAMGLFAMMAYTVAQRRTEFGIRLTFGATPDSIRWLVIRGGLKLAGLGVVIGLGLAWGLSRFMQAALYGVGRADWAVFAIAGAVMLGVALPACWWPALRAGRVDVSRLLRAE